MSQESGSSVSTTSIVFERISERVAASEAAIKEKLHNADADDDEAKDEPNNDDLETGPFLPSGGSNGNSHTKARGMDRGLRRVLLIVAGLLVSTWVAGLFIFVSTKGSQSAATSSSSTDSGAGNAVTLDLVMGGFFRPDIQSVRWIGGPAGEDGLLLEKAVREDYLVVEDVRTQTGSLGERDPDAAAASPITLMKHSSFDYGSRMYHANRVTPSRDLKRVLVATDVKSNWRHSVYASYWIFDVGTQKAEPLIPGEPEARVQLAQWSPRSNAIAFTRDNNLFLRNIGSDKVVQVTTDGGAEVFNGVPDWVYEEEVFASDTATWWSEDGNYIAFVRTNETGVPTYPVQYFFSRPSGTEPPPGEELYPETRHIKYPKAGAHNPVVELKFYDVTRGDVFSINAPGGFSDDDRLITEVVWAGSQVLVKETNRVSDVMRVVLVDVPGRKAKTVRTTDVKAIDGGWFEVTHQTKFIPADPAKGRVADGYIDLIIHNDSNHLAYFSPLDNAEPVMLTSGDWEVEDSPYAVDLNSNIVYFVATKESSIQRHVYQVKLTGEGLAPITDTSAEGYYAASFSTGAGYALLTYQGPGIPWQKIISTPSNPHKYERTVEENQDLADRVKQYALPTKVYGTINVDGVELNYVERRPPNFDERKKYPVLFHQYSGPGSQQVNKKFAVDFQSYVAAGLGYLCVTVDPRGTGYIGRRNRVIIRGELGKWESHDQIAAAKIWAQKPYVDPERLAIWGWSFGGFNTLKTLEQDAGQTFKYGMAVAPVTDWRFYDSIYTERYMLTPETNQHGYERSMVSNVTALSQNVRWLMMHVSILRTPMPEGKLLTWIQGRRG
jgi:dipeptidyl aminopeptidase